jgi:hypothetical protein
MMKALALLALSLFLIPLRGEAETLALRTFRELPAALEVVTGVSQNDPGVAATYAQIKGRLPVKGQVGELSSPTLLAIYSLAGSFCSLMVQAESQKLSTERLAFGNVDFTQGPRQFTPTAQQAVLTDLANDFWQRAPTADELKSLQQTFSDLITASGAGMSDTKKIAFLLCSEFGTSLGFLVN